MVLTGIWLSGETPEKLWFLKRGLLCNMIERACCQLLSKTIHKLTQQESCFQAECCDGRLHFTHFSFTVQLSVRCCPTVVARVVAEGLLAFRDLLILHHKYYPQYHSARHILSLLCSVLCLFAHVLILYAFNTHTLNTHRVMSRHSWRLSSNSQTVQMPLWSQLTALPLMTPLRGSILCSVCVQQG